MAGSEELTHCEPPHIAIWVACLDKVDNLGDVGDEDASTGLLPKFDEIGQPV